LNNLLIISIFIIIWIFLNIYYNKNGDKEVNKDNSNYKNNNNLGLKTYFGIFGILRTSLGLKLIDKIGKYRFWQKVGILLIPLCIIISILTFYMFLDSSIRLFTGEVPKDAGKPVIFLFGNTIPWIPGIIALIIGITIHELAHGIIAKSYNLKVKSTGLLLLLGIPLGAFVEIGDEFKNASKKIRGAVSSAGPMANVVVFIISILLTPLLYGATTDLTISKILENNPAYGVLHEGDIIYSINGKRITSFKDFYEIIKNIKPYEELEITVIRDGKKYDYKFITNENGKIGIMVQPSSYVLFALQTLYWTSMLNLMLGFFNLLPAIPLDGFHVWNALPELIRDLGKSRIFSKLSNFLEYIINEKNLSSISLVVWGIIFMSIAYSMF